MRSACDATQRKFDSRVLEGKSLSTILPSVSRTEKVSDSPCQGRAVKVNSQVFDLIPSRPAESRSVPLSVREAASLETTLRGVMESYNFQLWTITALFRFLCDSNCCPVDDPLLDQFQRSFSRGAENVAAALAASTAFVTAKRREACRICFRRSQTLRNANFFLTPFSIRKISLLLPPLRLPAKRQGIFPCIGEPNLALPRHQGQITGDNSTNPTTGVVTICLLNPPSSASRLHTHLQYASSRKGNLPSPPEKGGVFGSRSMSPRPA